MTDPFIHLADLEQRRGPEEARARALPERRAADVVVDILTEMGVKTVFVMPGGAIAPVADALLDSNIRTVTVRHECGGVFAAAAYARATGNLGVVLVTSGPGVLNTMTGLASAHCDGLPVLILAGEVQRPLHGRVALQEGSAHHLNIVGMVKHLTKFAHAVMEPNALPSLVRRAAQTALSGRRGPALLTIPVDVAAAKIRPARLSVNPRVEITVDSADLDDAARALAGARRPLILAGSGCRWGTGPAALLSFAERLGAPVATTPKAKGVFPESHPLSLGVFGHGGHQSATAYAEAGIDVLLAIGSGLSDPATNGWSKSLQPEQELIQIDVDAAQVGRSYPATMGLIGPAEAVLPSLTRRLPPKPARSFRLERATDPQRARDAAPEQAITPARALWELQQVMSRDTIYAVDIGDHLLFATHYLQVDAPDGYYAMTGLASMGSGIAAALGAKLARPERPVVAVVGDGCFSMGLGELQVAVQDRLPITVVVLNDQRYGMVENGNRLSFGRTPSYPSSAMHVDEVATALGARAFVVQHPGDLLAAPILEAHQNGEVLVLDVRIDPTVKLPLGDRLASLARVNKMAN